jgi:hypothetical protein
MDDTAKGAMIDQMNQLGAKNGVIKLSDGTSIDLKNATFLMVNGQAMAVNFDASGKITDVTTINNTNTASVYKFDTTEFDANGKVSQATGQIYRLDNGTYKDVGTFKYAVEGSALFNSVQDKSAMDTIAGTSGQTVKAIYAEDYGSDGSRTVYMDASGKAIASETKTIITDADGTTHNYYTLSVYDKTSADGAVSSGKIYEKQGDSSKFASEPVRAFEVTKQGNNLVYNEGAVGANLSGAMNNSITRRIVMNDTTGKLAYVYTKNPDGKAQVVTFAGFDPSTLAGEGLGEGTKQVTFNSLTKDAQNKLIAGIPVIGDKDSSAQMMKLMAVDALSHANVQEQLKNTMGLTLDSADKGKLLLPVNGDLSNMLGGGVAINVFKVDGSGTNLTFKGIMQISQDGLTSTAPVLVVLNTSGPVGSALAGFGVANGDIASGNFPAGSGLLVVKNDTGADCYVVNDSGGDPKNTVLASFTVNNDQLASAEKFLGDAQAMSISKGDLAAAAPVAVLAVKINFGMANTQEQKSQSQLAYETSIKNNPVLAALNRVAPEVVMMALQNGTAKILADFISGAVVGDFLKSPNGVNIIGKITAGFVPVLGTVTSGRDFIKACIEMTDGGYTKLHVWADFGLNGAGLGLGLVGIGGGIKLVGESLKEGDKIAEGVSEIVANRAALVQVLEALLPKAEEAIKAVAEIKPAALVNESKEVVSVETTLIKGAEDVKGLKVNESGLVPNGGDTAGVAPRKDYLALPEKAGGGKTVPTTNEPGLNTSGADASGGEATAGAIAARIKAGMAEAKDIGNGIATEAKASAEQLQSVAKGLGKFYEGYEKVEKSLSLYKTPVDAMSLGKDMSDLVKVVFPGFYNEAANTVSKAVINLGNESKALAIVGGAGIASLSVGTVGYLGIVGTNQSNTSTTNLSSQNAPMANNTINPGTALIVTNTTTSGQSNLGIFSMNNNDPTANPLTAPNTITNPTALQTTLNTTTDVAATPTVKIHAILTP